MPERFEDRDMTGSVFQRVDLKGARFEDVNLHRATFTNVNMGEVVIRDANMTGLTIESAAIKGLTIHGLQVDELIEAEMDRRDPVRVRLRCHDSFDPVEVLRVMDDLDQVRAGFRALLRDTSTAHLNHHCSPESWSALEHARHLLFAEDMYLNRWILRSDKPWCKLGFLPPFLENNPAYAEVGAESTEDPEVVLAAWGEIHADMRAFLTTLTPEILRKDTRGVDFGQGTIGNILQGMARHDLTHIRMAEAALQRA
jgi:hypothetical protein